VALKQVLINYKLDKERHSVSVTDCCDPCYSSIRIMELPLLKDKCNSCADVAVKLKDSALIVPTCDEVPQRIILGRIVDYFQLVDSQGCPLSEFKITIEYDDSQLVNPEVGIAPCDIEGFDCYTIGTEYLESIIDCVKQNNTGDVTLEGAPNYITIDEQVITRHLINLLTHVTGVLPVANGGTGLNNATIDFGTYLPTDTVLSNVDSTTVYDAMYVRIGNVVGVAGKIDINPTTIGVFTEVILELPFGSDLTLEHQLCGVVNVRSASVAVAGAVSADSTNDQARLSFIAPIDSAQAYYYMYVYTIL